MNKTEVEKKTFSNHHSGLHCAEAILTTFIELYGQESDRSMTKFASGFGGGIGASHCDACGALTGGIAAIGWLFGREDPSGSIHKAFSLSSEFRNHFLEKFGSTNCEKLLTALGKQENGLKCKKLTAEAAGMLYDILQKENGECQ